MGKTITSLKVDKDLWKKIKIESIKQDIQVYDIVNDALQQWLKEHK